MSFVILKAISIKDRRFRTYPIHFKRDFCIKSKADANVNENCSEQLFFGPNIIKGISHPKLEAISKF